MTRVTHLARVAVILAAALLASDVSAQPIVGSEPSLLAPTALAWRPWVPQALPDDPAIRVASTVEARLRDLAAGESPWAAVGLGAAAGLIASVVVWQLAQEADDESLLNGYVTAIGILGGAGVGYAIWLTF